MILDFLHAKAHLNGIDLFADDFPDVKTSKTILHFTSINPYRPARSRCERIS